MGETMEKETIEKETIAKENIAQIILCTNLGYNAKENNHPVRPFTTAAYNKLEEKMVTAGVTASIFITEKMDKVAEILSLTQAEKEKAEALLERTAQLYQEIESLGEKHIYVATRTQESYPQKMLKVMGKKAPVVLFYCGNLEILNSKSVSIIGSREHSEEEATFARRHAKISAQNNVAVVSGGARGIDTVAKESALKYGGKVITYVAEDMTAYIKKNNEHILWDKMLVISTFHPGMHFKGYNALERNKYIYASCDYAVVVSSSINHGGSFKGATACLKEKLTKLYVYKTAKENSGNPNLIEMGGTAVSDNHVISG